MKSTTEFDEIVVFGARGQALTMLHAMADFRSGKVRVQALVDDIENGFLHPSLKVPVISSGERLDRFADTPVMLGVGSPALRERIMQTYAAQDATFATVFPGDPDLVYPGVVPGAGSFCTSYTRIGPNVHIGVGTLVLSSVVSHDTHIGDHATLNYNSYGAGHVVIGRRVNIAPNAMISSGTREKPICIGDDAVIGVGCVIARDVPAGARMVGNPAMTVDQWRRLKRLLNED